MPEAGQPIISPCPMAPRAGMAAIAIALLLLALPGGAVADEAAVAPCARIGVENVDTDKDRYPTFGTVRVSGTGYAPGCELLVEVVRPDGSVVRGDGSEAPGSDLVTTDAEGSFSYVYELSDVVGTYTINVVGAGNEVLASMQFEDSADLKWIRLDTASGPERSVYGRGNTIHAEAAIDTGRWWRFRIKNAAGTIVHQSGCSLSSSDNSSVMRTYTYAVPADAAPTTGSAEWKYEAVQYTNATCATEDGSPGFKTFRVAAARLYANSAKTTSASTFGAGQTAYLDVQGLPAESGYEVYWYMPDGTEACKLTSTNYTPTASNSLLPTSGETYLQYPPRSGTSGSSWNRADRYASGNSCEALSAATEGTWKLRIRKNDGSTSMKDVTVAAFTVDATPPDTAVDSGPSGTIATGAAEFGFTGSPSGDVAGFDCRLDGPGAATGSFASCAAPKSYSGLADGSYTLHVRAKDAAGNVDTTPATRSFTVDTSAPDSAIGSGPSDTIATDSAEFAFSSSDGSAVFQCKLDGPGGAAGTFAACESPALYPTLADGGYVFSLKAVDPAGNESDLETRAFTIDTTAPEASIASGPETMSGSSMSFEFGSSDGAVTFQCKLDGPGDTAGSWHVCTSPRRYDVLEEGSYTFSLRAIDAARNVGPADTRSFSVGRAAAPSPGEGGDQHGREGTRSATPGPLLLTNLAAERKCIRGAILGSPSIGRDIRVRYTLSDAAGVTFSVQRRVTDARPRRTCPGERTRTRQVTAFDSYEEVWGGAGQGNAGDNGTVLGTASRRRARIPATPLRTTSPTSARGMARMGANEVRLSRIVGAGRRLEPGLYRLVGVAENETGGRSQPAQVKFWVLP